MPGYVQFRTSSQAIPARPASHNPLIHGSSPCGPTRYDKAALMRGFFLPIAVSKNYARFLGACPAATLATSDIRKASHPFIAKATVLGTGFSPLR